VRQIFHEFLSTYAAEEYWEKIKGADGWYLTRLRAKKDTLMSAINATLDKRPAKHPNRFDTALARATVEPDIPIPRDPHQGEITKPTPKPKALPALLSIKPGDENMLWGISLPVPRETWERLKAVAEKQYRTPQAQILYFIDRGMERMD
jgi:hypothetical protein